MSTHLTILSAVLAMFWNAQAGGLGRAEANLIVNSGFEQPVVTSPLGYQEYTVASQGISGWYIAAGSVDLTIAPNYWPAYQGVQSFDLDGSSPGTIEQSFSTTPGATYTLGFAYSNNFTLPSASARVEVLGNLTADLFSTTISHSGSSAANMNWQLFNSTFVANGSNATLIFSSLDASNSYAGIVLDAVSLNPVPEPSTWALLAFGSLALGGLAISKRREKRAALAIAQH